MKAIRASSPGRCGIIGNPTDGYGGSVISCSLAERATAEILPSDTLRVVVGEEERTLACDADFALDGDWFDIPKTTLRYLELTGTRIEIRISSEIPYRSGLAGSTAVFAAVFGALTAFKGLRLGRHEIAEHLHKIEREHMGIQCGYQDQYMAVFGGLNYMDFRDKQNYVRFEDEVFATVENLGGLTPTLPFVLAQTGVQRVSGTVLKPIRLRWEDGDRDVIEGYEKAAVLARRGKRALMAGDWDALGRLMNENHEIQQSVGASGPANDELIEAARAAGAHGAKLAGAGGGGTIIALTTNAEAVVAALLAAGARRIMYPRISPGLEVQMEE